MVLTSKIGITGSSGMLGKHVVNYLLSKQYQIVGTSRTNPKIVKENFSWKKLDLSEKKFQPKFNQYFKNINCLIHIGAYVPRRNEKKIKSNYINKVNTEATIQLAKWSKKNNVHFIFISGSAIYSKDIKNNEKSKILSFLKNFYLNSKIISEKRIRKLSLNQKFKYTILRPSSIYGTGMDKNKIIPKYLKLLKYNRRLTIYDYEKTLVNFIHAKDIAHAIYLCLNLKKKGIFNLGSKSCRDFYYLIKNFKKITKSKSKIHLKKSKIPKKIKTLDVNINKSMRELNWSPKISLKKGLKMIVDKKWI